MPNWVENELRISGKKDQLDALVALVDGSDDGDETCMDFDKIIPMPEALNVSSGSGSSFALAMMERGEDFQEYRTYPWVKEGLPENATEDELIEYVCKHHDMTREEMEELGHRLLENKRLYGAVDWYDWNCLHWGTKWNACEPNLVRKGNRLLYCFDTAWSPPIPVVSKLASMFPELSFTLRYFEGGMGFKGTVIYKHGVEVSDVESDYNGRRGG